jgi:Ca2+-dependent lipid-binding protein
LTTVLPGDGMLKIDVWDYDPLFSDELIGTTVIDIEDRFFDNKWQNLTQKPIERRNLYHPDLEGPQGWISMWVEVFEKKDRARVHTWDISPPPIVELEMRLIVWETEDTVVGDVEGMSDYYVTAFIDNNSKQSTDVHFRCEEGKSASFNWRIVMPITAPRENTKLNIQLMDNDFFSKDDYLAGSVFELGKLIKDVYALDVPIKFEKDYFDALNPNEKGTKEIEFKTDEKETDKFWLQLYKQGQVNKYYFYI